MNTFKVELLKLKKRKSTKTLLYIYSVVMVIISAIYLFGEKKIGLSIYTDGQFIGSSLAIMMSFMLPFIGIYISSTSFATDLATGSIKNMFLLPIKKTDIYIGKLLAVQSLIGILLSIQFIYTLTFSLLLDGGITLSILSTTLVQYIGAFVVLGLVTLLGSTIYLVVSSIGLTVMVTYLLYLGLNIASIYIPKLRVVSLTRLIGNYNRLFTQFNIGMLLTLISYYIILTIVGILIFEEKEASVCQFE